MVEMLSIDKTSMSLDDIIKMDKIGNRRNFNKKSNTFTKNSLNRAKKTIGNKRQNVAMNINQSSIVSKRNLIRRNIVIEKGNNSGVRVDKTSTHINERQKYPARPVIQVFRGTKLPLNAVTDIQITTLNDKFKKPNIERRIFNQNGSDSYEKNLTKPTSYINKRKSFNDDNDNFRAKRPLNNNKAKSWIQYKPKVLSQKQPDRRSDDIYRRDGGNKFQMSVSSKDNFRYSDNRNYNGRSTSFDDKSRNYDRRSYRSQDMEYGAMARALIKAHRDSKGRNYNDRYDNGRSVYR